MKIKTLLTLLLLGTMNASAQGIDDWDKQATEGHPSTWWHWMDGNVTRHGITADLEAMQQAGIREAQIFNVGMGFPAGSNKYLSPQWLEMVKWAATEAKRLGMTLCMHNGPGWSSSGGAWVKPEQSMQRVVWTETHIESNGKAQIISLPKPDAVRGYYEDIAVMAFPTPSSELRIKDFRLKSLGTDGYTDRMLPSGDVLPQEAIVEKNAIQRLSLENDGTIKWNAPKGNWTILRFGHTSTGTTSHPVNEVTGGGLECDKLSAEAMDAFWKDGIQPILDYLGPLAGTVLNNLLIDSYETGCGNWTPLFRQEFLKRMGYDCLDFYPTMAGYAIGSSEESERYLWDVRRVCSELMAENYYDRFRDLCHERGILFSTEPYTGPFDDLRVGSPSDIVMGEFWMGDGIMSSSAKVAASVAHVNGKQIVGAEAFTAGEAFARWAETHADMKTLGDKYWCAGINRFIFHTYVHQPEDHGPGYTLGEFASHLNRLNTIWPHHHYYMDYVNRSQYLLQQGRFVGDVLVFVGESAPNNGDLMEELKQQGYDYDEAWVEILKDLTVKDGVIYTPAGASYRVLALRSSRLITPETLQQIERLARAGATIVGEKPTGSPSMAGYPQCDQQVKVMADELWGKGIIRDCSALEALKAMGVKPDFQSNNFTGDLTYIHRSTAEGEVYFVSNQSRKTQKVCATFRVDGKQPEWWNPMTGQRTHLAQYRQTAGGTEVELFMQPTEAGFVVFRDKSERTLPKGEVTLLKTPEVKPLPGLDIVSAEFGHFLPRGVMDVTEQVRGSMKEGRINVGVGNQWGDPCFGIVKHMLVRYTTGGTPHSTLIPEGQPCILPALGEEGELQIQSAFYGALDESFSEERPVPALDVKEKVESLLRSNGYKLHTDELAAGLNFDRGKTNTLRVTYRSAGRTAMAECPLGTELDLSDQTEAPFFAFDESGRTTLTTRDPLVFTPDKGKKAVVKTIAQPLTLTGAWQVSFQGQYKTGPITLPTLKSLSEHESEAVRAFCGTAVYKTSFNLPRNYLKPGMSLRMELGDVVDAAEVWVNGTLVGCAWSPPYQLDVTQALKPGKNNVEIRVCIPWANRLITEEKTGHKTTFATYQHWNRDSQLLPAGLLKDIVIRPFATVKL